jgi:hypothetical protein
MQSTEPTTETPPRKVVDEKLQKTILGFGDISMTGIDEEINGALSEASEEASVELNEPDILTLISTSNPRASADARDTASVNDLDFTLDKYLYPSTSKPKETYQLSDTELLQTQNWGPANPLLTWPPPKPSPEWFAAKKAAILANPRKNRKANFGVHLTEETKRERRAKGMGIHQRRERHYTEAMRERDRKMEKWIGVKGVADFEPVMLDGKLAMREKIGTKNENGKVKGEHELRVLPVE